MVRNILFIISLGLLALLFINNMSQVDIAASKNDHLTYANKIKVDALPNIDLVKVYAKKTLDINRQNFRNQSNLAVKNTWIIFFIMISQITLWISSRKRSFHEKENAAI